MTEQPAPDELLEDGVPPEDVEPITDEGGEDGADTPADPDTLPAQ